MAGARAPALLLSLVGIPPRNSDPQQTSYTYNGADEMTQYQLGDDTATTYAYDGDGLRQSKTTGDTTTDYLWDESNGPPLLLQESMGDDTTSYVYGPTGLPLEDSPRRGNLLLRPDALGSTRALTDSSGAVQNTDTFDPYGNLIASTGSVANNMLYVGQYLDSESGLYYMRARYYDPSTAQFLTVDPLVQQTQEPYGYTAGDPVNESDTDGDSGGTYSIAGGDYIPPLLCTFLDANCQTADEPVVHALGGCVAGQSGCNAVVPAIGVCGDAGFNYVRGEEVQFCEAETGSWNHYATTETRVNLSDWGFGRGASAGLQISNTQCPGDLGGQFNGGSVGTDGPGAAFQYGHNLRGETIWTLYGAPPQTSFGTPELTAGTSNTRILSQGSIQH